MSQNIPSNDPQQPAWGTSWAAPQPPSKGRAKKILTHGGVLVVGLVLGVAMGGSGSSDAASATPAPTVTVHDTVTVTAKAKPAPTVTVTKTVKPKAKAKPAVVTVPGDGTYLVGTDIKPGTYKTSGPADSVIPNCYWERSSSTSGNMDGILANDNLSGAGVVTVLPSDKVFKTTGCNDWTKVS